MTEGKYVLFLSLFFNLKQSLCVSFILFSSTNNHGNVDANYDDDEFASGRLHKV